MVGAERTSGTRTGRRPGGRRKPPPPTVMLLVRHGTTATTGKELPGRAAGLHLSEPGRAQAEAVAARIAALASGNGRKGRRIAAVYSSPLERTRETAAPIAQAVGCDVRVDDGLLELDIGDWTGLELKAVSKRPEWATIQRYPSGFTFPGGESFVAMQARIVACLERLRAAHPGETLVAVSHADPIRVAVAHAMGTHLDLFQRVVISPCSLTAIAYGAGGPMVLTVNATAGAGDAGALVPS
ncbi:MAG TPA: MSMEG_4193 family putative phosphomutase [Acidimicrobiales bacterium]|jgi:probable phosphoglycerate mutase|nr:MSMEG_4193 family putative phosphomutase [Acidimicrobiales bacterium]